MPLAAKMPSASSNVSTKSTSLRTCSRRASSFFESHGPTNTTLQSGWSRLIMRAVSTMGVKATEMFFSNWGKSFLTMSLHDGQQDVTMNLCFSGTSSRKSAASSITHRSAPMATSYTSAKPRRWNALRIRSGTPSGPNCPTNAGASATYTGVLLLTA